MSTTNYGFVFVNIASLDEANAISKSLIEAKLAACVNIFPVTQFIVGKESYVQKIPIIY